VCSIAAGAEHSLAVTQAGNVFQWGGGLLPRDDADTSYSEFSDDFMEEEGTQDELVPTFVDEGFEGVRVRSVCIGGDAAFAIGEGGELFSWGDCACGLLGHNGWQGLPWPKRVEALRGVRVSSISAGNFSAVALAEDGRVYAWGGNQYTQASSGAPHVEVQRLPTLVQALEGVRVGSVASSRGRYYAVADTGELWAWGCGVNNRAPLGHDEQVDCADEQVDCADEQVDCALPKSVESLRGIKVDAAVTGEFHTLALAGNGSVYAWGAMSVGGLGATGALGLDPSEAVAGPTVHMPQRIPALSVTCWK
jgi:alpha-tubulin suppressor-like RCC1 family protein